MGGLRKFFVFLTGHRVNANTPVEDIGSLGKIGAAVAFAGLLAGFQCGVAGWLLAMGLNSHLQILIMLICAIGGTSIVLVLDRGFIYLTDTRYETDKKGAYFYISIRIFLIVVIGSLSSQFTIPLLMKSELTIHAQDLKSDRFKSAKDYYQNKYDLSIKLSKLADLEGRAEVLKNQITALTPNLIRQRNQASKCFVDYDKKIKSSIASGLDEIAATNIAANDKRECERLDVLYRQELRGYINPKEAELLQIKASINQMENDVQISRRNIESELVNSSQIDDLHINIASADVLSSLIRNNPGALLKYFLITLTQLILELMPIFLKSQAGQSPLGHKIALYSYQNKINVQNELNKIKTHRIVSNAEFYMAQYEQSLVDKELNAKSILFDAQLKAEKIKQDLENEKLQQELTELKHRSSFYTRIKDRFADKANLLPQSGFFESFTKPLAMDQNPKLRIIAEAGGSNYFVKVISMNGPVLFTAFIRSGDSFIFPMPIGTHLIKFVSGQNWYGSQLLFGQNTRFFQLKLALTFKIEGNRLLGHSLLLKSDILNSPDREEISELDF